jgi:hypothetical protein
VLVHHNYQFPKIWLDASVNNFYIDVEYHVNSGRNPIKNNFYLMSKNYKLPGSLKDDVSRQC